jgi:hypothetical protein
VRTTSCAVTRENSRHRAAPALLASHPMTPPTTNQMMVFISIAFDLLRPAGGRVRPPGSGWSPTIWRRRYLKGCGRRVTDNHFDAPILLPSVSRIVPGNRITLAFTQGGKASSSNTLPLQV